MKLNYSGYKSSEIFALILLGCHYSFVLLVVIWQLVQLHISAYIYLSSVWGKKISSVIALMICNNLCQSTNLYWSCGVLGGFVSCVMLGKQSLLPSWTQLEVCPPFCLLPSQHAYKLPYPITPFALAVHKTRWRRFCERVNTKWSTILNCCLCSILIIFTL